MKRQHESNINTGAHFDALYGGVRRREMMPYTPMQTLVPAIVNGGRVLDVGCGWGQYYPYLSAHCDDVWGIDFAEASIKEAQATYPAGWWRCVDFSQGLSWYDVEFFDYVTCFETLEHMEDPARLIAEIHRVLLPGGVALLSVPYRNSIVTPEHLWEYEESDWPVLLTAFASWSMFRYSVGEGDLWEHFLVIARKT